MRKIFLACVYRRVARSDRNIEIAADAGGQSGLRRLLARAQERQDRGFLGIGILFHDGRGNLHLRVARLGCQRRAYQTHVHAQLSVAGRI